MANNQFIRYAIKQALVTQIAATATGVTVTAHDPGARNLENEHIWIDTVTGAVDYTSFGRALLPHDDVFSLTLMVWVYQTGMNATAATADSRCNTLMNYVNTALSADPTVGQIDGLIDALLGTVEGPEAGPYQEGWGSMAQIEVLCHTRIVNP